MKLKFKIAFTCVSFLLFCGNTFAQILHFTDSYFNEAIPFVILDRNDGTPITKSDLNGDIIVKDTSHFRTWSFYHPEYHANEFRMDYSSQSDTIHIIFETVDQLLKTTFTDNKTKSIIHKVWANRIKNDPHSNAPFYYESYNKYRLSTTNLSKLKTVFDGLLTKVKLKAIKKYDKDHHLILSETFTQKRYLDKNNYDETIEAIKISGIESPTLTTVNSQFQSFSIYDPFIKILAKEYTNPLNRNTLRRYHFEIVKTYKREKDTLFIIKVNRKPTTWVENINAYYYINSSDYAIEAAILFPPDEKKVTIRTYKQYEKNSKGAWFPEGFSTIIKVSKLNNNIGFISVTENRFSDILTDTIFTKKEFNELAVRRGKDFGLLSKEILDRERKINLSTIDQNTFEFYDSLGSFKYFKNVADFAEKIYFKQIPFRYIDLVFDNTFAYNEYEKLRVGLGFETNKDISKIMTLGAYGAYGYGDDKEKYGARLNFHPTVNRIWQVGISATNDLQESGRNQFFKDKSQHSTEWQRKLKVARFDLAKEVDVYFEINPLKYLDMYLGYQHCIDKPLYEYRFNKTSNDFTFNEFHLKTRYAFGLRYFQLNEEKIPLYHTYPIVWFNFIKGFENGQNGLNYHILESKIQYSVNIIGFGKSFFQFNLGQSSGQLPYVKLFNAHGSEVFRSVTHNSFETMGYNEFVSSRYLFAFYAHQFGTLHISERFKPKVEMAFNTGIGGLSNRERHRGIQIKSLENGYFESGFLVTHLIRINTSFMKINLGTGYYLRFGPNSYASLGDNSVLKFVTQIGF